MSTDFSIKNFLKKNGLGPYGYIKSESKKQSLNENYVDLAPVGSQGFGGYTKMLREDEYSEKNQWMKDVHNVPYGEYIVNCETNNGTILWFPKDSNSAHHWYHFYATPEFNDEPGTPIEFVDDSTGEERAVWTEHRDDFTSFEDYAETILPFLEDFLESYKNGELKEDINDGPVGNDKLEEDSYNERIVGQYRYRIVTVNKMNDGTYTVPVIKGETFDSKEEAEKAVDQLYKDFEKSIVNPKKVNEAAHKTWQEGYNEGYNHGYRDAKAGKSNKFAKH